MRGLLATPWEGGGKWPPGALVGGLRAGSRGQCPGHGRLLPSRLEEGKGRLWRCQSATGEAHGHRAGRPPARVPATCTIRARTGRPGAGLAPAGGALPPSSSEPTQVPCRRTLQCQAKLYSAISPSASWRDLWLLPGVTGCWRRDVGRPQCHMAWLPSW